MPKFIYLKIWRWDGIGSLMTLEEGEFKVPIDGCINDIRIDPQMCILAFYPDRAQKQWHHKKLFLHFSILDTMYQWSMMKNIHSPNLVGIGS